jgi:hypothetical protein
MPDIRNESIIEYSYYIESPFFLHLQDWEFQTDIPVQYSEYKIGLIPFLAYRYRIQGTNTLDVMDHKTNRQNRQYGRHTFNNVDYTFIKKYIPSFKDESFISSRDDYIMKLDFQLFEFTRYDGTKQTIMSTWPELAKELLTDEDFGKYIKKSEKDAEKKFKSLLSLEQAERFDTIVKIVKRNYKWDKYSGKYARHSLKEFNKTKSGNIANINLYAIGMFRALGFEAEPIIIGTRDYGKVVTDFPFSDSFNYVLALVRIDDKLKLVDAVDGFLPNELVPANCINGNGFVVKRDREEWINIMNSNISERRISLIIELHPKVQKIEGDCLIKSTGFKAANERKHYYFRPSEYKEGFKNKGFQIIDSISQKHLFETNKPFITEFRFNKNLEQFDNLLLLSPFADLTKGENLFKQDTRTLPLDMIYKEAYTYSTTIKLPEGYKMESIPAPVKVDNDNVFFLYDVKITGQNIQVYGSYQFKKTSYTAKEYPQLKAFMNKVIDKLGEQIVLEKEEDLSAL